MISAVLSLLSHHCYSCQKMKSRLHTQKSTVVHMEDGGGLDPKNPSDQHFSQPHFIVVTVFSFLELHD